MFKNLGLAHEGILFFRKLCEMLFHSPLEIFEIFGKMESLESCRGINFNLLLLLLLLLLFIKAVVSVI